MKHIGDKALTFRLPVIENGALTFMDPDEEFLGQWVVLSFLPGVGEVDWELWNKQGKHIESRGATLLVVPLKGQLFRQPSVLRTGREHFTIVGDPLRRLQRLYCHQSLSPSGQGRTFVIDPDGLLRFHLVHSLTDRGMGVITELLNTYQTAEVPA